mgnify:CR=1 FL=1
MKSNKGITIVTLVITLIIAVILMEVQYMEHLIGLRRQVIIRYIVHYHLYIGELLI